VNQQPVNVTVVNRGCGSGCGTLLLILLALAAVGASIKYWYITVPVAAAVVGLALVGQSAAKKKTASAQGKAQIIDATSTLGPQQNLPSAPPLASRAPISAAPACTCGHLSPTGEEIASCPVHGYRSETASNPIPPQPAMPTPSPSEGQAHGHDSSSQQSPVFIADEPAKLAQLRDSGVLTEEEFADAKRLLLGKDPE
jgi:hypothetical protein